MSVYSDSLWLENEKLRDTIRVYRSVAPYTVAALKAVIREINAAAYELPEITKEMKARSAELKVIVARIEVDMEDG